MFCYAVYLCAKVPVNEETSLSGGANGKISPHARNTFPTMRCYFSLKWRNISRRKSFENILFLHDEELTEIRYPILKLFMSSINVSQKRTLHLSTFGTISNAKYFAENFLLYTIFDLCQLLHLRKKLLFLKTWRSQEKDWELKEEKHLSSFFPFISRSVLFCNFFPFSWENWKRKDILPVWLGKLEEEKHLYSFFPFLSKNFPFCN